jgi:hypothetical protein
LKPLPPATDKDIADQYWYGDPYSDATPWNERADDAAAKLVKPNGPVLSGHNGPGFDFVESERKFESKPIDKVVEAKFVKHFYKEGDRKDTIVEIVTPVSRYGVEWEDISKPEDRQRWVAGSRFRILDLDRNVVMAERIGYLIEPGFGSRAGARSPWAASRRPRGTTCPQIDGTYDDRLFALKVLRPKQ